MSTFFTSGAAPNTYAHMPVPMPLRVGSGEDVDLSVHSASTLESEPSSSRSLPAYAFQPKTKTKTKKVSEARKTRVRLPVSSELYQQWDRVAIDERGESLSASASSATATATATRAQPQAQPSLPQAYHSPNKASSLHAARGGGGAAAAVNVFRPSDPSHSLPAARYSPLPSGSVPLTSLLSMVYSDHNTHPHAAAVTHQHPRGGRMQPPIARSDTETSTEFTAHSGAHPQGLSDRSDVDEHDQPLTATDSETADVYRYEVEEAEEEEEEEEEGDEKHASSARRAMTATSSSEADTATAGSEWTSDVDVEEVGASLRDGSAMFVCMSHLTYVCV